MCVGGIGSVWLPPGAVPGERLPGPGPGALAPHGLKSRPACPGWVLAVEELVFQPQLHTRLSAEPARRLVLACGWWGRCQARREVWASGSSSGPDLLWALGFGGMVQGKGPVPDLALALTSVCHRTFHRREMLARRGRYNQERILSLHCSFPRIPKTPQRMSRSRAAVETVGGGMWGDGCAPRGFWEIGSVWKCGQGLGLGGAVGSCTL